MILWILVWMFGLNFELAGRDYDAVIHISENGETGLASKETFLRFL